MHKREWNLLFFKYDLSSVLEKQINKASEGVLAIPEEYFKDASDEFLSAQVASKLTVPPLEISEHDISVSLRDIKIDVSQDPSRVIFDRSTPFEQDGIEVTYHVPYCGEIDLLQCRPNSFTSNPPRAVIAPDELRFPYDQPDRDVPATKSYFERDLATLKDWLPRVNRQVSEYNNSLEANVYQQVKQRRRELNQASADLASLGFKIRSTKMETQVLDDNDVSESIQQHRATKRAKTQRKYDVALSFSGDDRPYVEQVANKLRDLGVAVFYDIFEQVNLWGEDLAEHLGNVYGKESRFVVLFLSRSYAAKAWPTHEKRFALSRHLSGGEQRILPVRFDETEIPGLSTTIGYLDLRVLTPEKLAELIRQKIDSTDSEV